MSLVTLEGHTILPRFVDADSVIVDVGANLGNFSLLMAERFNCSCHAIEANPAVFNRIPPHRRIQTHQLAIAGKRGQMLLRIHEDHECSSLSPIASEAYVGEIEVRAVTLEEFAADLNLSNIDVLKMDIEGCEMEVLDSCSDEFLGRVGQLTLELHDFTGQVSSSEVARLLNRLESLGFFVIKMARKSYIDTLAINRHRCPISSAESLYLKHGVRNWHGLKRMVGRWLGAPPPPNARPARQRL
jgi:FkbM family methyltransferase